MTTRLSEDRAWSVLNCLNLFPPRSACFKYFQRLLGHMASLAGITAPGLMHMLQHWLHGRVLRWAWCSVTHHIQPSDGPFISMGRSSLRKSLQGRASLLCSVHALHIYLDHTQSFRRSDQLFVCFGGQQKGKALSKQRIAHWIVDAIFLAYQAEGLPCG